MNVHKVTIIETYYFQVWEYGIPLCKELAELYERRLDYRKLSNILVRVNSPWMSITFW